MKWKRLHEVNGQRTFALVCETGDEVMASILALAEKENLKASHFTAIGALERVVLGYYEVGPRTYRKNPVNEQVEVLSLIGNIVKKQDGTPQVHAHIVVGKTDGAAVGGHLMEARVRPTLELIAEESPEHLRRVPDEA